MRGYHHGEDDSGGRGLDDPEQHQTGELHQREDVDLPQRHIAQIDQVRLVLGRHAEQLDSVKELQGGPEKRLQLTVMAHKRCSKETHLSRDVPEFLLVMRRPCKGRLRTGPAWE